MALRGVWSFTENTRGKILECQAGRKEVLVMRRYFSWALACFIVFVLADPVASFVSGGSQSPTVTLETGVLEGTRFSSAPNEIAFLGVRYAAPPLGELRWKPPQPAEKWSGARKATEFGAACPQLPAGWLQTAAWNEDCLFLNIWTTRLDADARRPVIVYFHGGSNTAGFSQMTPLGPALSRLGVVVVSANYRLGPLGFFAHPALTAESEHHSSGNYGLLDQLQALKWVRENISRFGGDTGRVTVMGQSAGAYDVCMLMASPSAAGLFQGAILQSGECQSTLIDDIRTPIHYNGVSGTGEATGERLATDLGITDGPNTLQKLRAVSADQILNAWSKDQVEFDGIVDGWVVPEQPEKIFAEGRQIHVPVIVGSNSDESTVLGADGIKTIDQYKKYLQADAGKYADQEFQAYPVTSDVDVPAGYLQLQNDFFAYGAYSVARAMTRADQKAYLYYFTYSETGKRAKLGAYHGEELMFVSDVFRPDWEHTPAVEKLGEAIRVYWTQFAKTDNPSGSGLPVWPAYDPHVDQCLELGRTIVVRPIPHQSQLQALEHINKQIFVETMNTQQEFR
jgi:para-nitrobenzyl esterase